jgi:hypothetical protein
MAGGFFLLGQAVAGADEGAGNINDSNNQSTATNTNETTVSTNVSGGAGGTNSASVNTGAIVGGGGIPMATTSSAPSNSGGGGGGVEVETGDVKVSQEANGGSVSNSGNVSVSGGPTQTATATADTTVDQTAKAKGGSGNQAPEKVNGSSMGGGGAGNINDSNNQSTATNTNETTVQTNVYGGPAGANYAEVNTGLILDFGIRVLDGIAASSSGPAGYYGGFEVETGDVKVSQEANGGDVRNSGNVWISGGANQTATSDATTDVYQRARSRGYDGGGAGNLNWSNNQGYATNYNETSVQTNVYGGPGGENSAGVNTGALVFFPFLFLSSSDGAGYEGGGFEVETGDVWLKQEANGGDVRNSGNVSIKGGANQTATAHAATDVHQKARAKGGDGAWNLNWSNNQAYATNTSTTSVQTNVNGGPGGRNQAEVNTGLIVFFGYLSPLSSTSAEYEEGGFEVETGDVRLKQEANGGDVRNSGNVSIKGGANQTATAHAATDVHQKARAKGVRPAYCRPTV